MSLKQRLLADLTASMKAQDALRTSTLRMTKAALQNREIEKGSELDEDEMAKLVRSLVKQRRDSVEQYEKGGRQELADKEKAEIEILEQYLPQSASREEIEAVVTASITETGATSMKDMGKVMKAAQAALAGKNADGRMVSEVVKTKLGG
jgi:uncharacterized protein YqeY